MERLAALAAEMRHMMGVFRYVRWAAGLSDAALAGPVAGQVGPNEAALMTEAMRAEADSRIARPRRRRPRYGR